MEKTTIISDIKLVICIFYPTRLKISKLFVLTKNKVNDCFKIYKDTENTPINLWGNYKTISSLEIQLTFEFFTYLSIFYMELTTFLRSCRMYVTNFELKVRNYLSSKPVCW